MKTYKGISTWYLVFAVIFFLSGFTSCQDENNNDETKAQFEVTIENTGKSYQIIKSGAFTIPVGASRAADLMPGEAFEFEFTAPVGAHFSFATMFAHSNDWFFSADEDGIALYNEDGSQVTGDVTAQIDLYDVGTEEDQEAGVGDNQGPRQSGPDTGPDDDDPNVRLVDDNTLPSDEEMIRVTLTSTGPYGFRVKIENTSDSNTLQTSEGGKSVPLSPGVWLVHSAEESGLLYTSGEPDYGEGLEDIAEDGNPEYLAMSLEEKTGLTVPLSPGAFAIYTGSNPIFQSGEPAPANGIENIAEDGQPDMLGSALESDENVKESGIFNQPDDANEPGILLPGNTYTFTFMAEEGDMFTFATMYAQSNDLFYSSVASGISLFQNGSPATGDVIGQIRLWDAGTEANAEPGIGSDQAPRQSGPDMGDEDPNANVREVDDGYDYGEVSSHIKVSISMINN